MTCVFGCLQVKGIPFLAFDAGGVLEMFDGKVHKDNVVLEPTLNALSAKLNEVHTFQSLFNPTTSHTLRTISRGWVQA